MSTKKKQHADEAAAPEHSGHFVEVDGERIEVPISIEAEGPDAVEKFVHDACAKHGIEVVLDTAKREHIYVPRKVSKEGPAAVQKHVEEVREKRAGKRPAASEPAAPAPTK